MIYNKWDIRYLELARMVSRWSKDPSTQTGAVLVGPDNQVVSLGFNGFPKGISDDENRYTDRETKYGLIIHCEMNAVVNAGKPVKGSTLYTWPFLSCERCCVHMVQAGIIRAVAPTCPPDKEERWAEIFKKTRSIFDEAKIEHLEIPYILFEETK